MLSNREKSDIRDFAEKITPRTWNICLNKNEYIQRAEILNVYIDFLAGQRLREAEKEVGDVFEGRIPSPIRMESNGRLFIVNVELCVEPILDINNELVREMKPKETLVHELAHVAVNRWEDWRFKTHKLSTPRENRKYDQANSHGHAFYRAFELLIIRTEKQFGSDMVMVKELRQELVGGKGLL